jgi:hypothetical protein
MQLNGYDPICRVCQTTQGLGASSAGTLSMGCYEPTGLMTRPNHIMDNNTQPCQRAKHPKGGQQVTGL